MRELKDREVASAKRPSPGSGNWKSGGSRRDHERWTRQQRSTDPAPSCYSPSSLRPPLPPPPSETSAPLARPLLSVPSCLLLSFSLEFVGVCIILGSLWEQPATAMCSEIVFHQQGEEISFQGSIFTAPIGATRWGRSRATSLSVSVEISVLTESKNWTKTVTRPAQFCGNPYICNAGENHHFVFLVSFRTTCLTCLFWKSE